MTQEREEFARIEEIFWDDDPFHALFRQAAIQIAEEGQECYAWEIGARAWARVPLEEQPNALKNLFVAYWHHDMRQCDEEYAKRVDTNGDDRMSDETLDSLTACVLSEPTDDEGYFVKPIPWQWIADVVTEVKTLRSRMTATGESAGT